MAMRQRRQPVRALAAPRGPEAGAWVCQLAGARAVVSAGYSHHGAGVGCAASVEVGSALPMRACLRVWQTSFFSPVCQAGYVRSALVVGGMWDLGLGIAAVGTCA